MAYQEITKTSYGKRLSNSSGGILGGIILFIGATILLFWNEGRAVKTAKMLELAEKECVDVADVSSVDASIDGKLIHAIALAQTDEFISDPDYPVKANAVRLKREAEYYQWTESSTSTTKDKVGGGQETVTTYTYGTSWTSSPVDSYDFKDPEYQGLNKVNKNVEDAQVTASNVSFGAYRLPESMVRSIPCDIPVELPANMAEGRSVRVYHNVLYYGQDPDNPQVGDVRVTFTKAEGGEASILAKVCGDTFESYSQKGKDLMVLTMGSHSAESMFEAKKSANQTTLWLLRLLGIILVIAGLRSMFSILVTLLQVLPPLAKIGGLGMRIVTFFIGMIWSLIIILISWVVYRPVLAIALLVIVVALIALLVKKSKKLPEPAAE